VAFDLMQRISSLRSGAADSGAGEFIPLFTSLFSESNCFAYYGGIKSV
jgi:hypothetical protein